MHFAVAILAVPAGLAAAQTTTSTTCAAANIVTACLASTKTRVDACAPTDNLCLCAAYQAQLTCYDNCPDDPNRAGPQAYVTSLCGAASIAASLSSAATTGSRSGSASTTGAVSTAASSSSTALAHGVAVLPAGSVFAVALGVFGVL